MLKVVKNCQYNSEFALSTDTFAFLSLKSGISSCVIKCHNNYINKQVIVKPALSMSYTQANAAEAGVLKKYGFFDKNFTTAHRSVIAYEIFKYFKMHKYLPLSGIIKEGLIMNSICGIYEFIDGVPFTYNNRLDEINSDLFLLAIIDMIIGNNDRHMGNIIQGKDQMYLIDNDGCFDYYHIFGNNYPAYIQRLLAIDVPMHVRMRLSTINIQAVLDILPKNTPDYIKMILGRRLETVLKWVRQVLANPTFSKNIGLLINLIQSDRMSLNNQYSENLVKLKYSIWQKIKRGESIDPSIVKSFESTLIT